MVGFKGVDSINKLRMPIELSGKTAYIRLLSVHEMLICETIAENLVLNLINEGALRKEAQAVAENAGLCVMCLVNDDDTAVFCSAKDVIDKLTPDELMAVANKYSDLRKKCFGFDDLNSISYLELKKN